MIKLNWGTGIVIGMIIFIIISLGITFFFMTQKVDLVTSDYYEKEIKYQEQIDKVNRTFLLDNKLNIDFDGKVLRIFYPDSSAVKNISGELLFYRPSDSARDFKLNLSLNEKGEQLLNLSGIERGYWKLQIHWKLSGQDYYSEKILMIN
jgi:hypothetical protein